jgi:hypothetical protein
MVSVSAKKVKKKFHACVHLRLKHYERSFEISGRNCLPRDGKRWKNILF